MAAMPSSGSKQAQPQHSSNPSVLLQMVLRLQCGGVALACSVIGRFAWGGPTVDHERGPDHVYTQGKLSDDVM